MYQIKLVGAAHQLDPKDCYRAWLSDGVGGYRWTRRTFDTEREATAYGVGLMFRYESFCYAAEEAVKNDPK